MTSEATFFTNPNGVLHVRCDAPGERAVSAPVDDPLLFIIELCDAAGLDYDEDALPDKVVISWPPDS